ncbi:MAG: transposase [Anaerolineae bacterium]|nr:transposase [Anaerolineae bacterium]
MNYTCSNLAKHLEDVSHDAVNDYLHRERLTARHLWEQVKPLLNDSPEACLIVDDSVQAKKHARKMELVKRQYSGNEGGLVKGIGVVNLLHTDGEDYYPIDFRIYAKEMDGKTKNDHFREMVLNAKQDKNIQANTVLFDSWYGSWQNLKLVHRLGMVFFTSLKSNRLVSLSKETGYIHLDEIDWTDDRLKQGVMVKLQKVPFRVRLFKLVTPNGDIDWVITNSEASLTSDDVQDEDAKRWQVEQLHRELKQLTGIEKCQCRKQRAQRNHIACCYQAWLAIKTKADAVGKTLYALVHDLLYEFLKAELRDPRIPALDTA